MFLSYPQSILNMASKESPWNVCQIRSMCLKPFVTLHLSGSRSILAASMVAHEALANMPSTHSALCSDLFLHALPLQLHWPLAGILLPQGLSCPLPGMFCPLMAARLTPAQIIIFLMRPTMSSHSHHPNPPWVMQEKFLEPCYHWFLTTLILQPIRADPLPESSNILALDSGQWIQVLIVSGFYSKMLTMVSVVLG